MSWDLYWGEKIIYIFVNGILIHYLQSHPDTLLAKTGSGLEFPSFFKPVLNAQIVQVDSQLCFCVLQKYPKFLYVTSLQYVILSISKLLNHRCLGEGGGEIPKVSLIIGSLQLTLGSPSRNEFRLTNPPLPHLCCDGEWSMSYTGM